MRKLEFSSFKCLIGWAAMAALVWLCLAYLVAPAAGVHLSELEGVKRYPNHQMQLTQQWLVTEDWRAVRLHQHLPYILLAWVLLGYLALWVSLHSSPGKRSTLVMLAVSATAAAASQAYGFGTVVWIGIALTLAVAALVVKPRGHGTLAAHAGTKVAWLQVSWIWGLWFLLVSVGVIWLTDLALRGPLSLRFIGLRQLDAMWLSSFVLLPISAMGAPYLLSLVTWLSSLWDRPRGPLLLSLSLLVALVLLVWVGSPRGLGGVRGYPHISSELIRLISALSIAWLMARHLEWDGSFVRTLRTGALVTLVLIGCLAVLVLTRDLGPVLALAVALIPVLLVAVGTGDWNARRFLKMALVVLAWVVAAWVMRYLLVDWLPKATWAPERLVLRAEALRNTFSAQLDYASQVAWLLDAAGADGFGLGSVPWCGARALVGQAACTQSSGVPVQFGSDYVFTATAAVWGQTGAVSLLTLTLMLIASVVWTASRQTSANGIALVTSRLHAWIVVIYAAMLMGQLLVSVSGNIGLIPLSGVTQPFLGLGSVALAAGGLWAGLAVGLLRTDENHAERRWLSRPLSAYFASVMVGIALFLLATLAWRSVSRQPIQDRLTPQVVIEGLQLLSLDDQTQNDVSKSSTEGDAGDIQPIVGGADCPVSAAHLAHLVQRLASHVGRAVSFSGLSCTQGQAVVMAARWAMGQPGPEVSQHIGKPNPAQIGVSNPYRLNGCIQWAGGTKGGESLQSSPCPPQAEVMKDFLRSSPQLSQALSAITTPVRREAALPSPEYWHQPRTVHPDDLETPSWATHARLEPLLKGIYQYRQPAPTRLGQGLTAAVSIDQSNQIQAQELLGCFVGPCLTLSGSKTKGAAMLESARARMAAVLVVDVDTGQIDVAASAHTPCYQAHHSGSTTKECLDLPQSAERRPWKIANQALHGQAMCGSLCKIAEALALLRTQSPLTLDATRFRQAIRESQTERFIDEFLCADQGFSPSCMRHRLSALVKATHDLGGQSECRDADKDCRNIDLMPGASPAGLKIPRLKLLTNPSSTTGSLLDSHEPGSKSFLPTSARECHASGQAKRWRGCKGTGLVAHVAELFGQGNASASPVGVGQVLVTLANAAQPQAQPAPVVSILQSEISKVPARSSAISALHARRLLDAMLEPIKLGGTAHSSCLNAITGDHLLNCDNTGLWVVAGKTGTPLFPHDALTLQQRAKTCEDVRLQTDSTTRRHEWARCVVPPTKWYAYLLGRQEGRQIRWVKAVVVLTERNWSAKTGMIDSPFDRGGNVAAEIGLRWARLWIDSQTELATHP